MRLLVSVRSGVEAALALEGGADIVDAKEPARGPLGAVDGQMLGEIASALAPDVPLSVALGDLTDPGEVSGVLAALGLRRRRVSYLKLGFAGVTDEALVRRTIAGLVAAAAALPGQPRVVAVAYADYREAGSLDPTAVPALAAAAGAGAVLLDTWTKDGRDLFAWVPPSTLNEWVAGVRALGLAAAVAGSIRADTIPTVLRAEPDIVGVRGAACEGGRSGSVSASRVRHLKTVAGAEFVSAPPDFRAKRHM